VQPVRPRSQRGPPSSPNEVAGERYPTTFYPGVSDVNAGSVIEVPSGFDLTGVDFLLPRPQFFQVRGHLIDSNSGQPPGAANITLNPRTLPEFRAVAGLRYDSATGTLNFLPLRRETMLFRR